jgi:hypothetical protein
MDKKWLKNNFDLCIVLVIYRRTERLKNNQPSGFRMVSEGQCRVGSENLQVTRANARSFEQEPSRRKVPSQADPTEGTPKVGSAPKILYFSYMSVVDNLC